jgi:hypothetical protein
VFEHFEPADRIQAGRIAGRINETNDVVALAAQRMSKFLRLRPEGSSGLPLALALVWLGVFAGCATTQLEETAYPGPLEEPKESSVVWDICGWFAVPAGQVLWLIPRYGPLLPDHLKRQGRRPWRPIPKRNQSHFLSCSRIRPNATRQPVTFDVPK